VSHVTMSQMLQATKNSAMGKWWLSVVSVALPRSDVQERLIHQREGTRTLSLMQTL